MLTDINDILVCRSYESPCGRLLLGVFADKLCLCDWVSSPLLSGAVRRLCKSLDARVEFGDTELIQRAISQLDEYFSGQRENLDIPLLMVGSEFQMSVWKSLCQIRYGETMSYSGVAKSMGRDKAVRAVANAVGRNPISIFLPCHRVVGSNGQPGGYRGGADTKCYLLNLESNN